MPVTRQTIVFADADALPGGGLEAIARVGMALVLCSSQTRAELEMRRQALGVEHPFVSENGSALFVPLRYFACDVPGSRPIAGYDVVEFGSSSEGVARELHRVAAALGVQILSFSRMSVEEVAQDGNLPLLHARLAKHREYQDVCRPMAPQISVRTRLRQALRVAGLVCVDRGRYDHVGRVGSASRAVAVLTRLYRRAFGPIFTVGVAEDDPHAWFSPPVDCCIRVSGGALDAGRNGGEWVERLIDRLQKLSRPGATQATLG